MELIKKFIPSVHKEGYYLVLMFFAATAFLGILYAPLGVVGLIASIWCVYFFRNPDRVVPMGDDFIVSPADGVVCAIEKVKLPENLSNNTHKVTRVSIFLNVFNVHVNRVPATGIIKKLYYYPGKFFNASLDKASIYNERQEVLMELPSGKEIAFSQIAGLIARRIVCDLKTEQEVKAGERFGIIKFGSRMDVYLPEGIDPTVMVGQTMIGGETIIADLNNKHGLKGEIR
jgi:phosphatidylserine decarboxylase